MAILVVRGKYAREADELAAQLLQQHGMRLSENSEKLLRVTVQGWHEEPPQFIDSDERMDYEKMKALLFEIFHQAADEDHVRVKKLKGEKVAFTDLFAGVFKGGQWVLRNIVKKGFSSEEA
jgi:hypothetical protein